MPTTQTEVRSTGVVVYRARSVDEESAFMGHNAIYNWLNGEWVTRRVNQILTENSRNRQWSWDILVDGRRS